LDTEKLSEKEMTREVLAQFKVLSLNLLGGAKGNQKKPHKSWNGGPDLNIVARKPPPYKPEELPFKITCPIQFQLFH
jgi:hypothetical protein